MKTPLAYQISQYDCVPTTIFNALRFLFDISDIPPEVVQTILSFSFDTFNKKGEKGKGGTTGFAIELISNWLNEFSRANKTKSNFKIDSMYIEGNQVHIGQGNKLTQCLNQGGVIPVRICMNENRHHFVLLTSIDSKYTFFFDPYYRVKQFNRDGIEIIDDRPLNYNRKVARTIFNSYENENYAMGEASGRECLLIRKE